MWRGVGFIRQTKLMLVRFVRLRGLPEEIAKGVALGIFIGMTPTFGFQMAIALLFAYLLRENRLAAILGVWVTNPVTAPVIYAVEYEMGRLLLGMPRTSLPTEFTWSAYADLGWNILYSDLGWRYHRRDHTRLTGLFRDSAHGADRQDLARTTLAAPRVASEV